MGETQDLIIILIFDNEHNLFFKHTSIELDQDLIFIIDLFYLQFTYVFVHEYTDLPLIIIYNKNIYL